MTRGSILIVAKDPSVREAFLRAVLTRGWSEVEVRESATEAVKALRSGAFGLAIVHADVGDMEGMQAVSVVKAVDPHVRILFATSASTVDLETRIRGAGIYYYYLYEDADSDELAAAVEGAVGAPRCAAGASRTVLVVDDDLGYQENLRLILEARGYSVLGATTVEDGLKIARAIRPALVLLDVVMESATDGLLFSREVRRDPLLKHTPILALSAMGGHAACRYSPRDDEELFPVDGFLEKPVAEEVLLGRVEALIGGREEP